MRKPRPRLRRRSGSRRPAGRLASGPRPSPDRGHMQRRFPSRRRSTRWRRRPRRRSGHPRRSPASRPGLGRQGVHDTREVTDNHTIVDDERRCRAGLGTKERPPALRAILDRDRVNGPIPSRRRTPSPRRPPVKIGIGPPAWKLHASAGLLIGPGPGMTPVLAESPRAAARRIAATRRGPASCRYRTDEQAGACVKFPAGGPIRSSPAVVGETVFVVSTDGTVNT